MKLATYLCRILLVFSLSAHGQGVNTAAAQAQQSMNKAATMNMMMGGMLFGMAMSQKPPNPLMVMMAAMMLIQGLSLQSQAQQAGQTLAVASAQPVLQLPPGSIAILPRPTAAQASTINSGLAYLASAGYQVNQNGTVKLPSGQIVTASALGSSQSLADLGFKPADIKAAQTAMNSATKELQQSIASTK